MGLATTTKNGFNTVSQSGSGVVWSNLSNMPYPTEGEADSGLTAYAQETNRIGLKIPYEASGIPTGAKFEEMSLYLSVKKTGTYSSLTDVSWSGKMNLSSSGVWTYLLTTDETFRNITITGDRSYWRISSLSLTDIITKLKSGVLYFEVDCETVSAVACGVRIKAATVEITYTTVEGKRGALLATLT